MRKHAWRDVTETIDDSVRVSVKADNRVISSAGHPFDIHYYQCDWCGAIAASGIFDPFRFEDQFLFWSRIPEDCDEALVLRVMDS